MNFKYPKIAFDQPAAEFAIEVEHPLRILPFCVSLHQIRQRRQNTHSNRHRCPHHPRLRSQEGVKIGPLSRGSMTGSVDDLSNVAEFFHKIV